MIHSRKILNTLLTSLLLLTLSACGGGGGGSDSSPTNNTPSPSNTTPSNPEPGTSKTLTLSWLAPSLRDNGDTLELSEIAGYEIYYFVDGSPEGDGERVRIDDPTATQYTTPHLTLGHYYFSIATVDTSELYSELSDYVEITID